MRRIKLGAVMAVVGLLAAACSTTYDRDKAITDLEEQGIERVMAECIVDGVEENFGIDRLESTDDLNADDEAVLVEITTECILGG